MIMLASGRSVESLYKLTGILYVKHNQARQLGLRDKMIKSKSYVLKPTIRMTSQ